MEQTKYINCYEEVIEGLKRGQQNLLNELAQLHHDLSQPLTSLGIYLEMLKLGLAEEEDIEAAYLAFLQLRDTLTQFREIEVRQRTQLAGQASTGLVNNIKSENTIIRKYAN